jgi:hypothetical protein
MAELSHHEGCPKCIAKGKDRGKDNLAVYVDESAHCFSCSYTIPSKEWLKANGDKSRSKSYLNEEEEEELDVGAMAEDFNLSNWKTIRKKCTHNPEGWRGLTKETCQFFDVMHEYNTSSGDLVKQYYPCTKAYSISGVRWRFKELNDKGKKDYGSRGTTGAASDLHGQWKFKNSNSKVVVITAGEIDQMSGHQMFELTRKKDYEVTPIVTPTSGEGSSAKQLQGQYEWLDTFEKIILCYDNDEAGQAAIVKAVKVLPRGKVYVMKLTLNDTNDYLMAGREKEWINAFWKAERYIPSGILGSGGIRDKMLDYVVIPKITLPPFMYKLQDLMAGGIPLGVIVAMGSASGTGKTTIVDECSYYWYFNSPHKLGVLTLEADSAQYGINLLSRHIGEKINLIESPEDKLLFLNRPEVKKASDELFLDENGQDRFFLVEERDGDINTVMDLTENLIIACDCKVIVFDPVSDVLEGLSNEEQAMFYKWMKGMVKDYTVTFILISHVRKNSGGQKANSTGAELHEEDFFGSGSIFKSSACNLLFSRDKEAENEFERNVTRMKATKIRWTGRTSPIAGEYYYDNATHTMFDKHKWLEEHSSDPKDKKFSMKKV